MDYKKELSQLIDTLVKEDGSDLHLGEGRQPFLRIGGSLIPLTQKPVLKHDDLYGFLDILLNPENKKRFVEKMQLDFAYSHVNKERFRGNAYIQQGLAAIALRFIPEKIRSFEELNLPSVLEAFTEKKQGFFLVVGPVGQGKSTTIAAIIELINQRRPEHVITIEDPIEYVFKEKKSIIDQREIHSDTPDFASALKNVFRQDVNVVLVGEMREVETISTAVTAAETGHFILSTLHTNSASQTVERIIDAFPPAQQNQIRLQLAGSLSGIFSQRLVPKVSGGLVPAYELLINNNAVANIIRDNRLHEIDTVIETSAGEGMIHLNRSLVELVRRGEISVENAYKYSNNVKTLEKLL
jgi:twitching motility protein PilT